MVTVYYHKRLGLQFELEAQIANWQAAPILKLSIFNATSSPRLRAELLLL